MGKKITIYTTNTCAYCAVVKRYLISKKQSFEVVNLDEQPELRQKVIDMSGHSTVPVTVIENELAGSEPIISVGWKPGELAAALA